MPAGDAQEILARPVRRNLPRHHLGQGDLELLRQQRTVVLRKVRHRREVAHAPVIDPLPDLAEPHLRLLLGRPGGDQRVAQLVPRQADDVDPATLRQLPGDGQHVLRDGRGGALVGHRAVLGRQDCII